MFRNILFMISLPVYLHAAEPTRIGVLFWSDQIPCQLAMQRGLHRAADQVKATGTPLQILPRIAGDGEAGIERQIRQMQAMLSEGVHAVIIQPTDNAALTTPLLTANEMNVPVVAFDQYISRGALASYISSDNYQAGYNNGEFIADRFSELGRPLNLILLEYPHVSSTVERLDGFLDALDQRQRSYKILTSYRAVDPASGTEAGRRLLEEYPEPGSVDVVFAVNDGGSLALTQELLAAGRDEIAVASIDGDPAVIDNIRAGRINVIDNAQFCGPMGEMALHLTLAVLRGQNVPRQVLLPVFPVTIETVDHYPGWDGPIPEKFTKPWHSRQPDWNNRLKRVE